MHEDDIRPYLEWEVTRHHRDGGWVWPKTDDAGDGPGVWLWLWVVAIAALAAVAGW